VVAAAGRWGVRLVLPLVNFEADVLGMGYYVDQGLGGGAKELFYASSKVRVCGREVEGRADGQLGTGTLAQATGLNPRKLSGQGSAVGRPRSGRWVRSSVKLGHGFEACETSSSIAHSYHPCPKDKLGSESHKHTKACR
jgi:hypothetical protein